ncbi:hypothetical protein LCGC14_2127450 [marine sediment metagenome]|uniref:DpnD/PcfM-like C-terminal domain-containing protein n=1 Tax=marine sediment metagenome TaxID=412755 RepID=A0A0F9E2D6_9ZZZZ
MKKYCVRVKETQLQDVYIEAENAEEAIILVREGEGYYKECHYLETHDSNEWEVAEIL